MILPGLDLLRSSVFSHVHMCTCMPLSHLLTPGNCLDKIFWKWFTTVSLHLPRPERVTSPRSSK